MMAALINVRIPDCAAASFCGRQLPVPVKLLAAALAAFEADDAVSRAVEPVRAARAAMAVRAQPARANENLFRTVTAGAFLRTHQFLP
ncbi:hypothetical protein DPM33_12965 [Mesorhizobium hawassense]|uniref:Uncharacterized protein n=1 Tax=Mesorhizobium hawassense TaxID=1209954 RepID=A0A330HRG7_9HYPH|nr:hypothetical protein DPM33_12965 [Mesorhizobium hawassense]